MRITSVSTYIMPFLILFLAIYSILFFLLKPFMYTIAGGDEGDTKFHVVTILLAVIGGMILFFGFRAEASRSNSKYFKYLLLAFPILLKIAVSVLSGITYRLPVDSILCGLLLYYSWVLFSNRYMATLTDTVINYKNLLGQTGSIPLTAITKIEQKSYLLSIFKEIRLLEAVRKTAIAFCDDEMNEYEINIYCRVFKSKEIFDQTLQNAISRGNTKIRLYSV